MAVFQDNNLTEWVAKIETRLQANPHDAEGWFALARDAQTRPVDQMRTFWERAVSHFPTHPYFWMLYIEQEIKASHFDEVEKLFSRCLHKIPSIDLSRQHVRYVYQHYPPVSLPNRERIREAYDQAIGRVGFDLDSSPLYLDYIRFLKECEAVGPYAEQQRGLKIREVFQKAVSVPMLNIELMWKEYCHFEQGFQPNQAEKIMSDRSREYTNAKKNAKILEPVVRALRRDKLPSPPRTLDEERHQIENWKKWVNFERANPLLMDDNNKLMRRIAFAYENCLMCMPYRLDMWLETAAHYRDAAEKAQSKGDHVTAREVLDSAASCMERGIVLYPDRPLFYLIIADIEEFRKMNDRVKKIFERCLKKVTENPTLAYIHYMLFIRRAEGINAAREIFKRARSDPRITQEIYTASALMEYFTTKDKGVALRIFELVFKKHPINLSFVRTYLDFMMLQNEQLNAKILVEKALNADSLVPSEKLVVAGKILEYDVLFGDYDTIQKTEKSRADLLDVLQPPVTTSLTASRLVSRWNYMDLTPLTDNDLRNMDYLECRNPSSLAQPSPFDMFKNTRTSTSASGPKPGMVMPDVTAMIPFKPRPRNRGYLSVPGGDYAFPETLEHLKRQLPPPDSFAGPFPDLDQIIKLILEENPKSTAELQKAADGIDPGLKTIAQIVNMADDAETDKIKLEFDPERRFVNDIYRSRLAKKMKVEE